MSILYTQAFSLALQPHHICSNHSEGRIAIVHNLSRAPYHVRRTDTRNFFQVQWDGNGDYPGNSDTNSCAVNKCGTTSDDSCLCNIKVVEDTVFYSIDSISKADVMSQLFIGALEPPRGSIPSNGKGFVAHIVGGSVDKNTVFEVNDDKGRTFFMKNVRSTVSLEGGSDMAQNIFEAEELVEGEYAVSQLV